MLKQALSYYDRGFSIIPQRLFLKKDTEKVAKLPPKGFSWKKYQNERVSRSHLLTKWKQYFKDEPGRGIGIITGELSNLLVIDVDDEQAEKIVLDHLPENFQTTTVLTPRGGKHFYFNYKPGLRTTAGLGNTGLDIRTDGGYVAAPPSKVSDEAMKYVSRRDYIFIDTVDPKNIPDSLFNHLQSLINEHYKPEKSKSSEAGWFLEGLKGVGEGARTTMLVRISGQLRRLRIPKEISYEIIKGWNQLNTPPETEAELNTQFNSIWKNVLENEDYEILSKMNKEYSIITSGNNIRIMHVDKWGEIHFFNPSDLSLKFRNQRIPKGRKTVPLSDLWLEWEYRKTYDRCLFDPKLPPNNDEDDVSYYNLWKGFSIKPKKGSWSLFREHIEKNIAPTCHEWVLKWMARIVQDPGGDRPGTTIVLRGKQGTGKGVFANSFGNLLGDHYSIINNIEHLTGRFNKEILTTLLLYIDEATWGGDISMAGMLKNLITESKRRMEAKNVDAIYIENHLNLIIASNNKWVVPGGLRERRFLVLDVSDKHMQDRDYFGKIIKQLRNGGYEAMMYDLKRLEYKLDELREIPKTEGTRDQSLRSLDLPERFWYSRLEEGRLVDAHDFWKFRVVTDKLYSQYVEYCKTRSFNRRIEEKSHFSRALRVICPSMETKLVRDGGNRFYCIIVPDLKTCRKEFDMNVTGALSIEWPDIAEPMNIPEKDRKVDRPGPHYNPGYIAN